MHFFLEPDFDPSKGILSESESHHALKTLRIGIGVQIEISDGRGHVYSAQVAAIKGGVLQVSVSATAFTERHKPIIAVALAPTKNPARFEWFVEKCTEMGADEIIPLYTARTERPRLNRERVMRIMHAAAKQSRQAYLPVLGEGAFLNKVYAGGEGVKLLAHCLPHFDRVHLAEAISGLDASRIEVWIGPEGDFTEEEILNCTKQGFIGISLGSSRLRTETAGIFSVSLLTGMLRK